MALAAMPRATDHSGYPFSSSRDSPYDPQAQGAEYHAGGDLCPRRSQEDFMQQVGVLAIGVWELAKHVRRVVERAHRE